MFALLIPVVIWFALKLAGCYEPELGLFNLLERLAGSLNYPLDIRIQRVQFKDRARFFIALCNGYRNIFFIK